MADDLDSSGEDAEEGEVEEEEHEAGSIFADYRPSKLPYGRPHPDAAVETASLAAVVSLLSEQLKLPPFSLLKALLALGSCVESFRYS